MLLPDPEKAIPVESLADLALQLTRYAWSQGAALRWGEVVLVRVSPADAVAEWNVFLGRRRLETVTLAGSAAAAQALLEQALGRPREERRRAGRAQTVSSGPCRRSHSRRTS